MNTVSALPRLGQLLRIIRSEVVWFCYRAAILLFLVLRTQPVSAQVPAPPIISPAAGPLACPITVTVSDATPGALIVVTTDGSAPLPTTVPIANPSTFTINSGTTFRAIALAPSGASHQNKFVSSIETDASFKCKAWGFADLHTHPATHLAFGADSNGNNGLFWGKPASTDANGNLLSVASLDLSTALQSCNRLDHNNGAIDLIQVLTDSVLLSQFDGTVKTPLNHPPFNHPLAGGQTVRQALVVSSTAGQLL
jgi:hypothetical protein